mgnify:FL=1
MKDERLAWAEDKLRLCRRIALRYFRSKTLRVEYKADRSPVTIADRKIEEYLRRELARAFPQDAIIGEEFGTSAHRCDTSFWTIDPIDGTRGFSRGLFSWGMLLGRVERGRAVLAACDFPLHDAFVGVAPGVAPYERRAGRMIRLARAGTPPPLSGAVLSHGGSQWWFGTRYERGFARVVRDCYLERAFGDCHAYLWLFRGKVDVVMDYGVKLWDLVPFAALAQATGRVLVDFSGRPSFTGPESILAHPTLAHQIAKILSAHTQSIVDSP